jgi:ribosomal protein S18 acetylase RimI-like enzyme
LTPGRVVAGGRGGGRPTGDDAHMDADLLRFREATVADVAAIVALVQSAYRGESSRAGWTTEADLLDGQRTDATEVAALIADTAGVLLLAVETAGTIVGCCRIDPGPAGAHLGMFAVTPAGQGGGLGGALLTEAERRCRARWNGAALELEVIAQRAELIAWYGRRGYRPTGLTRPFPYGDARFGLPRRADLYFVVLSKPLADHGAEGRSHRSDVGRHRASADATGTDTTGTDTTGTDTASADTASTGSPASRTPAGVSPARADRVARPRSRAGGCGGPGPAPCGRACR